MVRNATHTFTPPEAQIPSPLWNLVIGVNKVHAIWRWCRHHSLYTQPKTMIQLFAGHEVSETIYSYWFLRTGAQSLLIATRILECVKAHEYLRKTYDAWCDALSGDYVAVLEVKWIETTESLLSPSTTMWGANLSAALKERIQRVVFTTLQLCAAIFLLSMKILDAVDAVTWTSESQHDAAVESVVNIGKWVEETMNNKTELLASMEKNKALVEHILQFSPYSYDSVYNGISTGIDQSNKLKKKVSGVLGPIGEWFGN